MSELNDFLNLISEAKKESENKIADQTIENLSEKIKNNPFSVLLETTKIIAPVVNDSNVISNSSFPKITPLKKPQIQKISLDFKDTSFLSILESEIVKSKSIETEQKVKEEVFTTFFESLVIPQPEIFDNPVETIIELPESIEEIELVEEVLPEVLDEAPPKFDLTDPSHYNKLFKTNTDHFTQPNLPKVDPTVKALTDKIKYMEDWLTKISMAGPGSGEVNLRYLDDIDRPSIYDGRYLRYNDIKKKFEFAEINPHDVIYTTTLITTPTYTVNDEDYYVGVNYSGPVTITLPLTPNSGRMLIIKDESSNAEINPITVHGTVDNDISGFIIQINNGAIQLIYRNGWRIV